VITFTSNSLSVSLRNPELGDSSTLNLNITNKKAMDGTRWAYASPSNSEILELNFVGHNRNKVLEMENFIKECMGNNVLFVDPEGVSWLGQIINTNFNSIHAGPRNNTFSITFEGTKWDDLQLNQP
jgi:hypothetical protein